ncbi:MAG: hypothetical protein OXE58_06990, partial [Acidobacteria bacterium]|nr:hypothetical protein [Acidobacteriota bacterium]
MKTLFPAVAAAAFALGLACGPSGPAADAIYRNANVVTADDDFTLAEAFAILDGRFAAVGS